MNNKSIPSVTTSGATKPDLPSIPPSLIEAFNILAGKLSSTSWNAGEKLKLIYDYVDLWQPYVAQFATCKRGCAHCCNFDVGISQLEAEYISIETSIPMEAPRTVIQGNRTPCPFLSESGQCNIYPIRPLACRLHHSVDPDLKTSPGSIRPHRMECGRSSMNGWPVPTTSSVESSAISVNSSLGHLTTSAEVRGRVGDLAGAVGNFLPFAT